MYQALATAGVGTIVGMHQTEKHRESAQAARINVVIAGHMSSDSLGMNLFLDELEKRGVEIVPVSGLIRVSRNKTKRSNRSKSKASSTPRKKSVKKSVRKRR
jgi:hypothetical protein